MAISPYLKELRDKVGHRLLIMPGVAAVIRDATGRILLQKRTDGLWSLPAGAIDPGEAPAQALVREVWEETGLRVRPRRLLGVFGGRTFRYTCPNGDEVENLSLVFDCEVVGGVLGGQDDETAELHFFVTEEMPQLPLDYPREVFASGYQRVYIQWDDRWIAG
jgi:8-oxo-dGTP pyrophosphatase MutT (NUDIX family)